MNKKILSGTLAAMMLISPTYAIDTAGGTGDVPVHLTQEVTQFSVTVPTVLPVDVSAEGVVTVANDNKIINHSFGPVEVKSVSVESLKDWKLVDFNTDFKTKKVGLHEYGFQMNQADVQPDGSCAAVFDVIPGNGQINFVYDSKVATQNMKLDKENIANVVFTIGWSDENATRPQLNATHKVSKLKMNRALQKLTGNLTFTTTAYTGSDGIDISENGDGSVIAVVDGQDATVYSEGGVLGIDTHRFVDGNTTDFYAGMFNSYQAKSMDLRGVDTSKMWNMKEMFGACVNLVNLNFSGFNTSNISNMSDIFSSCFSLTSLDLSGMDMSQVTDASSMFSHCTALTTLDLSGVNMNQLRNTSNMFLNCTALTYIDLSGISMDQVTDTTWMFMGCTALKTCYAKDQTSCNMLNELAVYSDAKFIIKSTVV